MTLLLRIIRKLFRLLIFFISIPFSLLILIIFPFYKIKFICLFSDRIGHFAANTELLLCYLDRVNTTKTTYLYYLHDAPICNKQLYLMWKRTIPIISPRFTKIIYMIDLTLEKLLGKRYKSDEIKRFESAPGDKDIYAYFENSKPHLVFTDDELQAGEQLLESMNISKEDRYVCLLVRDSSYLDQHLPGGDWSYHTHRDCDIQNFQKAAFYLVDQGYYVIRMGKVVNQSFNIKHPKIIDYPFHPMRSDFADIFLCANCTFFITTSSGLDAVPQIFRKPIVIVDMPPVKGCLPYSYPFIRFITKKVTDNDCLVNYETIDCALKDAPSVPEKLDKLGWTMIENNPEEILAVIKEVVDTINNPNTKDDKNELHALLKGNASLQMIANRECLRKNPEAFKIKIGREFWNKNKALFLELKRKV